VSSLLVAFLVVAIVPLLASSWRVSLLGLSLQGLLMGAIAMQSPPDEIPAAALLLADLFLVRGLLVPRFLYGVQLARNAPRRNDVIPANIFLWAIGGALVFVGFQFAHAVVAPERELHVAIAISSLLLALLVLGSAKTTLSQVIGVLRLENAIALLELSSPHHLPIAVHAGVVAVFTLSLFVLGGFLRRGALEESTSPAAEEGPTL
jgi:hydrogenase-4 component E